MLYYNLRSLIVNWKFTGLVTLILAVASGTLLLLLTAEESFTKLLATTTEPENFALVMRGGFAERWPEVGHIGPEVVGALREIDGVAASSEGEALISPEVLLTSYLTLPSGRHTRVTVRGVGRNAFGVHRVVAGTAPVNGVIIGSNLQKILHVSVGEEVVFMGHPWKVAGFFTPRGEQTHYDSEVWAPLDDVMRIRNTHDYAFVSVKTKSSQEVRKLVASLNAERTGRLKDVRAIPEKMLGDSEGRVLQAFRAVYRVLSTLVFLVAGLGTLNVLLQSVFRRRRHMALLRAMGYTVFDIARGFFFEGAAVACIGSILGCLVVLPIGGSAFVTGSMNRPGVTVVLLHFTAGGFATAAAVGIVLGCVCSLVPAIYVGQFRVKDEMRVD